MIDDTEGEDWVFRRDDRVRRPIESLAGRASTAQLAVLSTDVQLLYKSKGLRDKDIADFRLALRYLSTEERAWLHEALERYRRGILGWSNSESRAAAPELGDTDRSSSRPVVR